MTYGYEYEEELGRVAVLSDIHGVLPALEAVLAEPEVAAADRIVLTGDITAGPQPAEVIDLLRKQGDRLLWVSGNADRELVEYRRGERDAIPDPIGPYAASALRAESGGAASPCWDRRGWPTPTAPGVRAGTATSYGSRSWRRSPAVSPTVRASGRTPRSSRCRPC